MRIIAGEFKGRNLVNLKGRAIRPTSDRVREALFSILAPRIDKASVLDLFAGTGALGIEALSRGAAGSVFVDISKNSIKIIEKNIELLGIRDKTEVFYHDAHTILSSNKLFKKKFNMIFIDPPYNKGSVFRILKNIDLLKIMEDDAVIIAEHSAKEDCSLAVSGLELYDSRAWGDTGISFFKRVL